jgi:hypothetical protein
MKKQLRKNWWLGFLGIIFLQGFTYFNTHNWMDLLWFLWLVWFIYFIPVKGK